MKVLVLAIAILLVTILIQPADAQTSCAGIVVVNGGEGSSDATIVRSEIEGALKQRGFEIANRNLEQLRAIVMERLRQETGWFKRVVDGGLMEGACWLMFVQVGVGYTYKQSTTINVAGFSVRLPGGSEIALTATVSVWKVGNANHVVSYSKTASQSLSSQWSVNTPQGNASGGNAQARNAAFTAAAQDLAQQVAGQIHGLPALVGAGIHTIPAFLYL